ncbi:hypothetical protein N7481_002230 [Penicillium waksmanii]|uniref:uncharacterized protein n=1 Tax=Penicillium waksmanii TaxID=69791 RepID=UPI0025499E71|nr:uncharacterized protein N7481_002230 [Penicillium waksmanii]KAJ5995253.1 hypothetical protein N7481_002230 [Penicillium waksmanii]
MKWPLFFTILLLFLYCSETLAAPAVEFQRREPDAIATTDQSEEQSATKTATDNGSTQTSTTTATDAKETKTTTSKAAQTASTTTTSDATTVATTVPSLDTSAASGGSSSQNSTKSIYTGGLPLQPDLSPALGVGGFILLISGAALALIGIRKRWLYISLSTAFLAALGVIVLIEYVMNPPVTNAVQGGYLVAVVVTGAVFGGLALVFKEITEGLCCLLGGFCIGMWLMTVKAGGLVTESGAKVGFIIAFSAGFYCLSFSHYTRSYGSMVCTSFGGATALVLGIDCFSRAGLKEFWLYVWGLNDNMFPLNTNTYPVTRNIRVELAITIIVTVFGVIAQMRLWKVIKERRANEASSREEEEKKKEEAEAEVGRQLEKKNQQERAEWERMYGNGSAKEPSLTETAVADDSRRGSDGFNSSNNETAHSIEMKEMACPDAQGDASDCGNTLDAVEEVTPEGAEEEDSPSCGQSHHTPAFHVSTNVRDDTSENGAIMGSEAGTPRSKRLSGMSFRNRLSWRSGNGAKLNHQSESEEALVAHDDATSSVAGVVDDIQTLSSRRSSIASEIHKETDDATQQSESTVKPLPQKNILQEAEENHLNSQPEKPAKSTVVVDSSESRPEDANVLILQQTNDVQKSTEKSLAATAEPSDIPEVTEKAETAGKIEEVQKGRTEIEKAETPGEEPKSQNNSKDVSLEKQSKSPPGPVEKPEEIPELRAAETETKPEPKPKPQPLPIKKPVKPKLDTSTVNRIPERTSKVVHTFRTNEWAKHLADAETPDLEPLEFEPEPIEHTKADEAAAPVNVDELLQTPLNAQPPPAVTSPVESSTSPDEARRRSRLSMAPVTDVPRSKTRNSTHMMSGAKSPMMSRNVSSSSLVAQQLAADNGLGPLRSPSAPLLTITMPNTGHDNDKEQIESPRWSGPPPLLAVREDMVRNRMSSTSLRYDPWGSRNASRQSLVDPGRVMSPTLSIPDEGDEELTGMATPTHDDDDVPLSKRRAMLQRQTMESPSTTSLQGFDRARSSPSASTNPGKPAAAMAAWRQSMREDISSRRDLLSLNSSPTSPERPQSLWGSVQQMKDASNTRVGDAIAEGMQKGSMTDLHRQAMRRMQASANQKL